MRTPKDEIIARTSIRNGELVVVESYWSLRCSACDAYLGRAGRIDGHGYDDTAGWEYCPYCGRKMEDTL
jgi:Zn finger protein HypA/HybF involved in hydrogenase expression